MCQLMIRVPCPNVVAGMPAEGTGMEGGTDLMTGAMMQSQDGRKEHHRHADDAAMIS